MKESQAEQSHSCFAGADVKVGADLSPKRAAFADSAIG
jgi:hypothetical protein